MRPHAQYMVFGCRYDRSAAAADGDSARCRNCYRRDCVRNRDSLLDSGLAGERNNPQQLIRKRSVRKNISTRGLTPLFRHNVSFYRKQQSPSENNVFPESRMPTCDDVSELNIMDEGRSRPARHQFPPGLLHGAVWNLASRRRGVCQRW